MKNATSGIKWKASGGALGVLVLLAILVAVNVILVNIRLRVDLTEEKLYTLSKGTRSTLANLDESVTLKLFFNSSSAEVPVYLKNYARQVEDLLREYKIAGKGNVIVEKYDPKPDSDAEEWAQRYGLSGQPMGMFGPPVYLGLVAVAGDTEGAIPALDPRSEQLLEYNVTRLVYRVTHPEKPRVGVLSSLPVLGTQAPPQQFRMPNQPQPKPAWVAFSELRRDYQLEEIPTDAEEIPAGIETLLVVHPKDLSDKTLFAIDQFTLKGGRLMVFLDPMSIADMENSPQQQFPGGMAQQASNLEKLLQTWGIDYDPTKVLADTRAVSMLRGPNGAPQESPVVLSMTQDYLSKEDILTTQLETMMMAYVGTFADRTDDAVTVTPLITSSKSACMVNATSARFGPQALRSEIKSTGIAYNLALRLSGKLKTAFPDGKPKDPPAEGEEKTDEPAAADNSVKEGESTVLLVGDVDLLYDALCVQQLNFLGNTVNQPRNDNLNFFANGVEQVAGSADLIGIRSRGKFNRPFTEVIRREEEARNSWKAREDELVKKLQDTQQKLNAMQTKKDNNQRFILSPEQQATIKEFREAELTTKRELKGVRKELRRSIEQLGVTLKVINIGLMPALICIVGVSYGLIRKRKA